MKMSDILKPMTTICALEVSTNGFALNHAQSLQIFFFNE